MIFDAHAHYDDAAFDADREAVLSALPEAGVGAVINAGCNLASCRTSVALAEGWTYIHAAVGIYPGEAHTWNAGVPAELRAMALSGDVVAIGEIGLDYHYPDNPEKEVQRYVFEAQLALAGELNLPVVIHERDALTDTLEIISRYPLVPKMFHCFSGSPETAKQLTDTGCRISLGGAVTFKNAKRPPAVLASVPLECLLTETDCPYMAPVPFRGQRCDSRMITRVLDTAAELRRVPQKTLEDAIYRVGTDFFRLNV